MQNDLSHHRKSYQKRKLLEKDVHANPIQQFQLWFSEASNLKSIEETNAMTLSTVGSDGFPRSRVVLLKQYSQDGFVFYTNYNSEKGKSILRNPKVCLSFFWQDLERQVIIKGTAQKTSEEISEAYFQSRQEGSKLGAIVSSQSEVIASREELESALENLEKKYKNKTIPRPEYWGGIVVKPTVIEFWQGRPNRLHDRIQYTLQNDLQWKIERLAP